jgi:hypothetical protein
MPPKKGLKRNVIDKYYTQSAIVDICLTCVQQTLSIEPKTDLIIEPSAGNGAFIPGLKKLSQHYKFYDLQPEHSEIETQDYLTWQPSWQQPIHIIGNPPFGRQASTAIKFIKKSSEFAQSISFILPKSFKKESMKKCFPLDFHLRLEMDLPAQAFLVDGQPHDVPCVFQIWEKNATALQRALPEKIAPLHYTFVKKTDQPDIAFRRVGVNAGSIDRFDLEKKSEQSHYFLKFTEGRFTPALFEKLKQIQYATSSNTVGPKSIGKQELIKEFNMVF